MIRNASKVLLHLAIAVGLVVTIGSPAGAADGWQRAYSATNNGTAWECTVSIDDDFNTTASGCFQPYGDWIWVKDEYTNRQPVAMIWLYRESLNVNAPRREGVVYLDQGTAAGWLAVNKNFAEGGYFYFSVCEINLDNRDTSQCNHWYDEVART